MHLLFDLDGTLTDPKQGFVASIRYALSSLGVEIGVDVQLESCIGPPLRDTLTALCGDARIAEDAVALYRERYSTLGLYENQVYDGIPECLEQLVDRVESIHVATSKPTIYSERIIENFELGQYFNGVYGSELDGRFDDKTELINHILRRESLDPENTVMIGDRRFDVIGARNNDISVIGVLWGYGEEDELNQAGADRLCSHPRELHDHLFGESAD